MASGNHNDKFVRPENFDGQHFKRWKQKMFFYLTTLKVAYVINQPRPSGLLEPELSIIRQKWDEDDYLCKNYILSALSNQLYDLYCEYDTSAEIWKELVKKYKTEEAGVKKKP